MSNTSENIVNYDGAVNYSTEEKVIGTWVDGKPLYQKTISASVPSSGNTDVVIATLDASYIIRNMFGMFDGDGEGDSIPIQWPYSTGFYIATWYAINEHSIKCRSTGGGYTNKSGHITIQYTKTTD